MRKMTQPMPVEKAKLKLEDLCSRSEQCEWELREKMKKWGLSQEEANAIIHSLKRERYLDEGRFARAFVNDKIKFAKWGKRKVAMALAAKRVPKEIIAETLDSFDDETYYNILCAILRAKIRQNSSLIDDYEGRTRLYKFAAQRGFESSLISHAIKAAQHPEE